MERILNGINAINGVLGSFVCDEEGEPIARALPDLYDEEVLGQVGRTVVQTTAGLWMARQTRVGDVDLLFTDGRLVIRSLERACLCILCTPRLNLPLLNLTANLAVKKLQQEISAAGREPAAPSKRERLKHVAQEVLGDHAARVVDMLDSTRSDAPEALQAVCKEAVRFTGFFMSREKAEELGRRMQAVIER